MTATWEVTLWLDDVPASEHADLAAARLIWQYRGSKPRMQAVVEAFVDAIQDLETAAYQVMSKRWPLTAEGVQLDTVGKIVGQARGELADAVYRRFILGKILVNKSKGRATEIGDILDAMGYPTIDIWEYYPCELFVSVAGEDYGELVGPFIADAVAGGVAMYFTFSDESAGDTFSMASTLGADDVDADTGFGDLTEATQTTGGYWSGGYLR